MSPNAVHQILLVSTNLEAMILAELIEDSGGAVSEILDVGALGRIFDLFGFENLLGFFVVRAGNLFAKDMLEEIFHASCYECTEVVFDGGVDLVLGDEGIDA